MDYKNILLYITTGCLLVFGRVSASYNQTYGGYSFILSNVNADNSGSRTALVNAQEWCSSNGYSLATIPDKDVQNYILQFIKSSVSNGHLSTNDLIILNGKLYTGLTPDTWMWVNKQPRNGDVSILDQRDPNQHYFYGFLKTSDYKIHASTHDITRPYICEYPGNDNNCAGGLSWNGRCYQRYTTSLSWYSARNKCLEGGGDLASFETLTDSTFNSTLGPILLTAASATEFWVGIQRAEWRWEDTGLAIKYTNWETGSPSNFLDCVSLRVATGSSEWLWYTLDCSRTYRIICIANVTRSRTTSVVTRETSPTKTVSGSDLPIPSSSMKHTSITAISPQLSTDGSGSPGQSLALGLGIGLGMGAIFIAIVVVIVIFCIRRRQKSCSESRTSFNNSNDRSGLKESSIDASAAEYIEIKNNGTNKDGASIPNANSGAIYASVQSNGTLLPPTNDANTRGKQIVYAQFDLTPN